MRGNEFIFDSLDLIHYHLRKISLNRSGSYNQGEKSLKAPFMIYAYLEYLLEKMYSCQNNPEKSYT